MLNGFAALATNLTAAAELTKHTTAMLRSSALVAVLRHGLVLQFSRQPGCPSALLSLGFDDWELHDGHSRDFTLFIRSRTSATSGLRDALSAGISKVRRQSGKGSAASAPSEWLIFIRPSFDQARIAHHPRLPSERIPTLAAFWAAFLYRPPTSTLRTNSRHNRSAPPPAHHHAPPWTLVAPPSAPR
jgi:hypothetical protein